jgi:hypothetical protein
MLGCHWTHITFDRLWIKIKKSRHKLVINKTIKELFSLQVKITTYYSLNEKLVHLHVVDFITYI